MTRISSIFFLIPLVLLFGNIGRGDDAPQWGEKHSRNCISPEKNLPIEFKPGRFHPQEGRIDPATTENVRWTAPIGDVLYGTPVVAEGCVFVGSNRSSLSGEQLQGDKGVLSCLDEKTGSLRWELVVPKLFEIKYSDWHRVGICSTPVVENGKVYTVTNRCEVVCLDIHGMVDGNQGPFVDEAIHMVPAGEDPFPLDVSPTSRHADILWCCDMVKEVGAMPHNASNCSVLMDGDVLYVCTGNGVDWSHSRVMNPEAPTLIVVDKKDGKVLAVDDFGIGPDIIHGQWSSPSLGVVGDRRMVVQGAGNGWIYAVDALTPQQVEQARKSAMGGKAPLKLKNVWRFNGHPAAQSQEVVALEHFHDTKSYEVVANPVFIKNRIFVVFTQELYHNIPDGWLVCLDATLRGDTTRRGGLLWSYREISSSGSTVAVADGLVYVADNRGRLHCLDEETGKPYWVHTLGGTSVWGSPLVADGKVYIGTGRRLLWTLRHGKELEVLGKTTLPGAVQSSPVAANGVLYVPVFGTLYAIEKKYTVAR